MPIIIFLQYCMNSNKLSELARGCNSQLYSYGEGDDKVVLKMVSSLSKKEQKHLKNEYSILKNLNHQHVIRALQYQEKVGFQGNKMPKQLMSTKNILVLEYANQGSLLLYLQTRKPSYSLKRQLYRQIVEAIAYLHSNHLAHRDLKLQNILVHEEDEHKITLKVSDFGFSSYFKVNEAFLLFDQYKGTRKGYMPPEIIACQQSKSNSYDPSKADIFSLGVLLFALVLNKLPFEYATSSNRLFRLIQEQKWAEFWAHHSEIYKLEVQEGERVHELKELFSSMVSNEPAKRPTAEEVLKNSWLI